MSIRRRTTGELFLGPGTSGAKPAKQETAKAAPTPGGKPPLTATLGKHLARSQTFMSPKPAQGMNDHINQYHPQGENKGYKNAAFNCGPTVVAMIARQFGVKRDLTDAELIEVIGAGHVTPQGTTPESIQKMLAKLNIPLSGEALGAGFSHQTVAERLNQGEQFIAQVGTVDPKTGQVSPHYVLVRKTTADGYLISDPLATSPQVVSQQQLKDAVLRAPPDGGVLIPVAKPSSNDILEKSGSTDVERANFKVHFSQRRDDMLSRRPANAGAFTASDDVFQGVDTSFDKKAAQGKESPLSQLLDAQKLPGSIAPPPMEINYGDAAGAGGTLTRPLTPDHVSVAEFAELIRQGRMKGDPAAYELLGQLASSTFPRDREVLAAITAQDRKDPGVGKKTLTEF